VQDTSKNMDTLVESVQSESTKIVHEMSHIDKQSTVEKFQAQSHYQDKGNSYFLKLDMQ
jgi:hypothetical protein